MDTGGLDLQPFFDSIEELVQDLHRPVFAWQVAVVALASLIAWFVAARLRAAWHRRAVPQRSVAIEIGAAALARVVFPLVFWLSILAGRGLLVAAGFGKTPLLRVAVSLAFWFALIRLVVYVLRRAFPTTEALRWIERTFATAVWVGVALHVMGLWDPLMTLLDSFALPIGHARISVLDLVRALLSVSFAVVVALWAGSLVESRLMGSPGLDRSLQVVFARVTKALFVAIAVTVGLTAVGFDLTVLSVFGGALGVGLGFGLQKAASNYVSGFMILLDKSLRIGDIVTVDKYSGAVSEIKTRYTVIKALDGTEAIVPNEMLVSNPVTNFSFSDRSVWLSTKVQVAYDSDVASVMRLLEAAARGVARVLPEPPPRAYLSAFAADGFDLTLGFWIRDPEQGRANVTSDVNMAIWRALREHGVEIPYAQREVRVAMIPPPDGAPAHKD